MLSPFWRLYYDGAPGHKLIFLEREVRLGPDRMVLIPDHCLFHCQGEDPVACLWLHFSCSLRPSPAQAIPILLRPGKTERDLLADLADLFRRGHSNSWRIFCLSVALLQVVLSRPELHWLDDLPETLRAVIRHIEQHHSEPLYTPELARLTHLGQGASTRLSRKHRGVTPAQFIIQVRVREATHLLSGTNLALDDIPARTGFPNAFYLSRVFKRFTGEAPAQFRRLRRLTASDET